MVDYRTDKINPHHTQLTLGVDIVNYPGDCSTPTVSFTKAKLLLNSIVSTINIHFMKIDIKHFYLNTPMTRSKYMRLKLSDLCKSVVQ